MRDPNVGLIVLNSSFEPLAANREAVRILAFPTTPEGIRRVDTFLSDKLRTDLIDRKGREASFVWKFRSGKRRYTCSAFRLEGAKIPTAQKWSCCCRGQFKILSTVLVSGLNMP